MTWKNKTDKEKFEFESDGDFLSGKLLTFRPMQKGGLVYDLLTEGGELVYFFGSAQLDSILPELKGRTVKITYKGMVKLDQGRSMRDYEVDVWEDDPVPDGYSEPPDDVPN